jgi:hypothetical protein
VATHVLDDFEVESSQPFQPRDFSSGSERALSGSEAPPFAPETYCLQESSAEDGSCVKAILVATILEGAMVIGIYGLWKAWHLFR